MSSLLLLLYGFMPLVIFVLVDIFAGMRWAVGAAVVAGVAEVVLTRATSGSWDLGSIIGLALVVALGLVSLKLNSSIYFKMQPAVLSVLFALILVYFQLKHSSVTEHYAPMLKAMAGKSPELAPVIDSPMFRLFMAQTERWLVAFFLIYAALMAVVAKRAKNWVWLVMRGAGFWGLFIILMIIRTVVFVAGGGSFGQPQ